MRYSCFREICLLGLIDHSGGGRKKTYVKLLARCLFVTLSFCSQEPGASDSGSSVEAVSSPPLPLINYFMGSFLLITRLKIWCVSILVTLRPSQSLKNIHYTGKNTLESSSQAGGCLGAVCEKMEGKESKSFRIYWVHEAGVSHGCEWCNRTWEMWQSPVCY